MVSLHFVDTVDGNKILKYITNNISESLEKAGFEVYAHYHHENMIINRGNSKKKSKDLEIVDAIISDKSSIVFDLIAQGKPAFFIDTSPHSILNNDHKARWIMFKQFAKYNNITLNTLDDYMHHDDRNPIIQYNNNEDTRLQKTEEVINAGKLKSIDRRILFWEGNQSTIISN
mgnify:CR=1 FL=1